MHHKDSLVIASQKFLFTSPQFNVCFVVKFISLQEKAQYFSQVAVQLFQVKVILCVFLIRCIRQ